jgi:hypothetical protein
MHCGSHRVVVENRKEGPVSAVNPSGILVVQAGLPEEWPPAPEHTADALLDVFSRHLIAQRDRVVRRAYETIAQQQPYARGRAHQRPFTALEEMHLDDMTRDKIVDVVAVFVDEAIEHVLGLFGSVTNTVGEYDTVEYELTGQIHHHEMPAEERYSTATLMADWHKNVGQMLAADNMEDSRGIEIHATEDVADLKEVPEAHSVPIGQGAPLWYDYRKWLSKYCTFRRSARPTH